MKLKTFSNNGTLKGESEFAGIPVFESDKGTQALKEVIVAQAANARQGTASTKTRAEVSGGGKKPYKQKGTGRARQGSITSPLFVGGGVVFGPRPRDYSKKINKKVRSLAFRRALFERAEDGSIGVLESLDLQAKTKGAIELFRKIGASGSILLVDSEFSDSSFLAIRNIAGLFPIEAAHVSATDLCRFDYIVITSKGLETIIERAKGAE